jgi:predicted MFS family arabinose efflux permease
MGMETTTTAAGDAAGHPLRSLWRNRDYLTLWGAEAISALGTQASALAFPLLILAATGSPAQAGLMGAIRGLPYLLFGLPAGGLVDRWDRKRVLVLCDTARALALGSIPLALALGRLTAVQLYAVSFVEGTLFIFFGLASTAALRRMVPPAQLPTALAQGQATQAAAGLSGPALGGALFGLGRALPFALDALSYVVSVVALLRIRTPLHDERDAARRPVRAEVVAGLRWLWSEPVVRRLLLLHNGQNLLYGGWSLLLIALARRVGASDAAIGLLFASGGLGSILGSAIAPSLQRRLAVGHVVVGMAWIFALSWPPYALASTPLWLGVVNILAYVLAPTYFGALVGYRLVLVPDALQGRINSAFRLGTFGSQTLGFLLMGVLLEWSGAAATVWLLFAPKVALALLTTLSAPLRRAGRVVDAS